MQDVNFLEHVKPEQWSSDHTFVFEQEHDYEHSAIYDSVVDCQSEPVYRSVEALPHQSTEHEQSELQSDFEHNNFTALPDNQSHNFEDSCACASCVHLAVYRTGKYNFQGARIPLQTSLKIVTWLQRLDDYHDKVICDFLQYGWPVNYTSSDIPLYSYDNHPSAYKYGTVVNDYINSEIQFGAISGPYHFKPFNGHFVTSPLQTVPKDSRNTTKRRVVIDLSFPPEHSVNSGIPRDEYLGQPFHLSYPTVDTLAALIKEEGVGCYLFRLDLARAYRQIPTDPFDYRLLGFHWDGMYYIDTRLPFGLASAAMACQRTTNAVSYMFGQQGHSLINYLDDFASANKCFQDAVSQFYELKQLLSDLGLQESADKAIFPTQIMIFLGVLFNTLTMTMEVTPERLQQILDELKLWNSKKKFASKRKIQSLIGKLQFVAKCVRPGRLFISRMLEVLRSISHNNDKIRISQAFKADIFWWQRFMEQYNGVSVLGDLHFSNPGQIFQTDSCLTQCGGVCNQECFSWHFPGFILEQNLDINCLELLTIVVACKLWGRGWTGQRIIVQCDNEVSANVINYGRSRSQFLNKCARELLYIAAQCEFDIRASHISGATNRAADNLSRGRLAEFFREHPDMVLLPYKPLLFHFQHDW